MFLVIYFLLLGLLVVCEGSSLDAHIRTLGQAVRYSLVTISTVGYGDMTPVTPPGHVIGVIFLLMSMGLLAALTGAVVSFLTSGGFPMFILRFLRKRDWYYFADFTPESDTLAKDILRRDEDAVIIYGISREDEIEKPDYSCLFINVSPARIVGHKKSTGVRCKVFFLRENETGSNTNAQKAYYDRAWELLGELARQLR